MEGESPKAKAKGKHLRNSCGSESGKGERKQTESRVRRTGEEDTGNQVGKNGEKPKKRKQKGRTGEAAVRRNREEKERKNRRLSSWKQTASGRKKASRKWKMPEARAEGKHLWNGCGSEAGKSERKRTVEPSTGTWKEGMRNQAGEKGETEEARAESGAGKASARRNREEKERKSRG